MAGDVLSLHLVLVTVALTLTPGHSHPCSTVRWRVDSYELCFTRQGIHLEEVFDWYRGQAETGGDFEVPIDLLFAEHGKKLCTSHRERFERAVRCCYQVDVRCADPSDRHVRIDPGLMVDTLEPLCRNRKEIDFTCAITRHEDLLECAKGTKQKFRTAGISFPDTKCMMYYSMVDCTKRHYQECGCQTALTYSNIALDLWTPSSCPTKDLDNRRVVCDDSDPQEFLRTGLGSGGHSGLWVSGNDHQALWLLSLSLAVLVIAAWG